MPTMLQVIRTKSFPMQSVTEFLHVAPILKLKLPHCKINQGLTVLSYIGSSL